jgi:DME family drug/metabolite transporter
MAQDLVGTNQHSASGTWLVLLAAICWGTTGTAQAFAPESATPLAVGAVRLAIGGAALLLWALVRRSFQSGSPWPVGATVSAAVCMAVYQLCFFAAVDRTGVAAGTVVAIGSAPVIAGILGWLVQREAPGWPWALATSLAVTGCVLLGLGGGGTDGIGGMTLDLVGILLAVGAGGSYAVYVLASKGLVKAQRPEAAMGVVFALGALLLTPLYFLQDFSWLAEPRGMVVALHLGLVTLAIAYALFAKALMTTPVAIAVTLTLGEPLTATLLGVLVLRESLTGQALLGVGMLLAGLVVLALSARGGVQSAPVVEEVALQ